MSGFTVQQATKGTELMLVLEGAIDEDVQFPPVNLKGVTHVHFDLKNVKSINSVGIREWLNWIRPISDAAPLTMYNCPKTLVFQFNMVEGFLPKNASVRSLFVPFFCEKCDKEENFLFNIGKEIELGQGHYNLRFDIDKLKTCGQAQCGLEMDVTEAKYFQFLKKMNA